MCNKGEETASTPPPVADIEAPEVQEEKASGVGFHLRWSRLSKTVQVKEVNAGLLRGSIASKSNDKAGPVLKTIMDEVSGSAKPGEVLAMMGPSGTCVSLLLQT